MIQIVVAVGASWIFTSIVVALSLGRAIKQADERAEQRYAEMDADLTKVEDQVAKLLASRTATTLMPVLPKAVVPTQSVGKHARRD